MVAMGVDAARRAGWSKRRAVITAVWSRTPSPEISPQVEQPTRIASGKAPDRVARSAGLASRAGAAKTITSCGARATRAARALASGVAVEV